MKEFKIYVSLNVRRDAAYFKMLPPDAKTFPALTKMVCYKLFILVSLQREFTDDMWLKRHCLVLAKLLKVCKDVV